MPSSQMPSALSKVSFEQRLNEQLPLDLQFKDESGRTVKLGEYFGRKPVVLTFVYYECPMLCTQVLNGLESALRVINESIGKEFDVITVSFDPKETPVLASGKKKAYLERYKRPSAEQGWHFLTGDQASIDALTKAAGFNLLVGRGVAPVRARQRHRGGDAGRQAVAVFLRHRLLAARREVRADRIVEREDRHAGGAAVALLLSLRSGDGQLRVDGDARGAAGRRGHARGAIRIRVRIDPARSRGETDTSS